MKVLELKVENYGRLEVIEIVPNGALVIVSGANEVGKSSAVDALFVALQASKMLKDTPQPVREGQDKATVTLNLGDYVVVRTIKPDKTTTLKVTTAEGVLVKSPPQSLMDGFMGSMSIDPSVFIKLKPSDQVKILVELVDTEGFLAKNDGQHDAWYSHRTTVGHVRDQHKAVLDANPKPDLPDVKPDVEALKAELKKVREQAEIHESLKQRHGTLTERIKEREDDLANAQDAVDDLKSQLGDVIVGLNAETPPYDTIQVLEEEHANAIRDLAGYDKVDTWNAASEAHTVAVAEYDNATDKLKALKINRQGWLAKAILPVDGLGFDFEAPCVTYKGLPLQQASTSGKLKVGVAIAMAQNPELRIVRIRDGNCFDRASFATLDEMATENDFQFWIEKVDETGDIGFYIEDGKVVAVDGEPVPQ